MKEEIISLDKIQNLEDLIKNLHEYNYQGELTKKLDDKYDDFSYETILEIVLWKTNRFPKISSELISNINRLRKDFNENLADNILMELLDKTRSKGFDLPMASTVMRFINPNAFQIIDQRVYRILYGKEMKVPYNSVEKVRFYKDYLSKLKMACINYNVDFKNADRIFYLLDKHQD